MSWRSGSSMFIAFWPLIQQHIPDRDERIDFTAELLKLFLRDDMGPSDVEDVDADVRAALVRADIGMAEPQRYDDISESGNRTTADPIRDAPIELLRSQGPDFPIFSLQPSIASTKRRAAHDRFRLVALMLVHFLQDHGLTTRAVLSASDAPTDDFVLRVGDLSDDGLALYCAAGQQWLRRIDHGTSPTDSTVLVNALQSLKQN